MLYLTDNLTHTSEVYIGYSIFPLRCRIYRFRLRISLTSIRRALAYMVRSYPRLPDYSPSRLLRRRVYSRPVREVAEQGKAPRSGLCDFRCDASLVRPQFCGSSSHQRRRQSQSWNTFPVWPCWPKGWRLQRVPKTRGRRRRKVGLFGRSLTHPHFI